MAPTLIMVRTDLDISIRNNKKDPESSLDSDLDDMKGNGSALGSSYELQPTGKAKGYVESQGYDVWVNFKEGSGDPLSPKEPQNDGPGISGLGPLVNAHAGWDAHNAPPPAFSESQQGSSTMLISAGPLLLRNEKSSQHGVMIVLNPPVIAET
ncbi:hypothetical protein BDP27DRAFT_1327563 [Rhodocollybia butyracea]|uniref:Uncharacterized protein n=1 Tax=Rhodocollybia butyracea TaxID=206335 RepID=A0A9P5PM09_9AGAR|nr:hypothetical protein BDP27DRAFT_1327563 [Rhodocollybia butyracea]